jgi:Uma2 family endonuclease
MVLHQERLYTTDEFREIARLPENEGRRLELDEGVIIDMGSSSPTNSVVAMRIGYYLNAFVIPHDAGFVSGADGGYQLAPRKVRQPDVGFVSKARLPALGDEFGLAPDLAVEVVSPNEDVFKKATEYLRAGTRVVWAVYPDERTVYVFRLDEDGSLRSLPFGIDDTLEGGEVLPGFALPVRDIFPA